MTSSLSGIAAATAPSPERGRTGTGTFAPAKPSSPSSSGFWMNWLRRPPSGALRITTRARMPSTSYQPVSLPLSCPVPGRSAETGVEEVGVSVPDGLAWKKTASLLGGWSRGRAALDGGPCSLCAGHGAGIVMRVRTCSSLSKVDIPCLRVRQCALTTSLFQYQPPADLHRQTRALAGMRPRWHRTRRASLPLELSRRLAESTTESHE